MITRFIDGLFDTAMTIGINLAMNWGMVGLLLADVYASGVVMTATLTRHPNMWSNGFCWIVSAGTNALSFALWRYIFKVFREHRFLFMILPALIAIGVAYWDMRFDIGFVTLNMYGLDFVHAHGMIPEHQYRTEVWKLWTGMVFMITNFGDPAVALIRATRSEEIGLLASKPRVSKTATVVA